MLKYLFVFSLLSYSTLIHVQFHTIELSSPRYAVKRVLEEKETAGKKNWAESDSVLVKASDSTNTRQRWIERYLSVSYPLKAVYVISPYGKRKDPFTGKTAKHNGLDLRANNEEVYAMLFGKVEKIGNDKRSGLYIMLRHGDYTVSYCHLSKVLVKKNDIIQSGQPVAISGNTGRSTAPHLHITLKRGRKTLNPTMLLDYVQAVRKEAIEVLAQ